MTQEGILWLSCVQYSEGIELMEKISHKAVTKQKSKRNNTQPDGYFKLNRIGRLKNSKEIGRFVSRIIHLAAKNQKRGEDVTNNCYKLTVMASMLAKIIEGDELKQRIKDLEEIVNKEKSQHEISPAKSEPT